MASGGKATLVRDKITGLFHCPCGAPSHAFQDGQRMFGLCKRRVHPSTNDDVAKATVNEQDASAEEDDDDEDESQPCILISSSPSPATSTSSTLNPTPSASAHLAAGRSSSQAGSASRTRHKVRYPFPQEPYITHNTTQYRPGSLRTHRLVDNPGASEHVACPRLAKKAR